ncbi:aminotransferase class I/II-fold pyridoxal phosphate-dependent enzyme [Fulvivirga sp. M361]|uniref:threonine aldolase family protein n=1 Tax=Fulvivirga sp. M361 TaxID=2594266 RepID=UPI00117AA72B|nr:GntG family PLP-dependent aldolase [Fulvivirga sp. M361]TRX61474.1 aminotransferase class I/II-fold pyridoxal phosphate-dependent enzyme [Fulvivirga sp. M361]
MIVDLRSDTLTKPTPEMMEAMMNASVGDDVFGEDPTVNELEKKCAELFDMEDAIYCPSGTMTNQIGLNVLSQPYEEVICYEGAHIYRYEGGGVAGNSGLSFRLLKGNRGRLNVDDIKANINPDDIHFPKTSVIALENTVNKGGGCHYQLDEIRRIRELSMEYGLKMHLDGARLFNALVETGEGPAAYGKCFDTLSLCLSKGLGAPVGSVLIGKAKHIKQARRVRKFFGGGMRQAGYLAAAGLYALDHHVNRLKEDHYRANEIGKALIGLNFVDEVLPVDTNIVIFRLADDLTANDFLQELSGHGVKAVPFGSNEVRFVTHLDFNDEMLERTIEILKSLKIK